jgi:hypothetical protein
VFASILLLIAAAQSSNPLDTVERITPQEAAKRFTRCGLGPVTIRWNDPEMGGEDIIVATGVRSATDEQLRCADRAVSYYTLELLPDIQRRFLAIREARFAPVFQAQARAWLSARRLLRRVPRYRRGETDDATFTRQVEKLCGPDAQGAFQSQYGFHAVSPDWVRRNLGPPHKGDHALLCLMNVGAVADFKIGFIGNEYIPDK